MRHFLITTFAFWACAAFAIAFAGAPMNGAMSIACGATIGAALDALTGGSS